KRNRTNKPLNFHRYLSAHSLVWATDYSRSPGAKSQRFCSHCERVNGLSGVLKSPTASNPAPIRNAAAAAVPPPAAASTPQPPIRREHPAFLTDAESGLFPSAPAPDASARREDCCGAESAHEHRPPDGPWAWACPRD